MTTRSRPTTKASSPLTPLRIRPRWAPARLAWACGALWLGLAGPLHPAQAVTVDFDSIVTTSSFPDLGLTGFLGFTWSEDWGSNFAGEPLVASPVLGVSGETSAANSSGARCLGVDFGGPTDVTGGFFRQLDLDDSPASAIELVGLDGDGAVVAGTGPRPLPPTWTYFPAGFEGVHALEICSDAEGAYFGVDNLILDADAGDLSRAAADLVIVLPEDAFLRSGRAGILPLLDWAVAALEAGYPWPARVLLQLARTRTDGCVLRGEPDGPMPVAGRGWLARWLRRRQPVPDLLAGCGDQRALSDLIDGALDALSPAPWHRPWH